MRYKFCLLFVFTFFSITFTMGNDKLPTNCSSYFSWEPMQGTNTGIQFTNQSNGNFNSWEWDFGDGITSEVYHPVHEYSSYGTYYVCLTVTDGVSCTDVFCDTVTVEPECVADFNFTYVPTTPIYVQFTDLSTGYPDTWFWNFGDGTTSTDPNPVHPYVTPGTYNVCLIIEHSDPVFNCSDTICKTVFIPDSLNCQADFGYDIDPDNPLSVNFTDYSTGNITDWEWNFGDGSISNEQNPVHIFPGPADYMVCLKVENSDSSEHCIHFICETISLEDPNFCTANFSVVADSNSQVMYQYTFQDNSSGNPDLWLWEFGDGYISHDQNPVHVFEGPGTYEVCLDTWNSNFPGCTDSHCILVKTAEYYQLGGLAFIGDNPINNPVSTGDTGMAVIYRQRNDNSILAVDTTSFHDLGYYWFSNMMEMGYLMKISLTKGSVNYPDFIPSYYPGTIHWQDADEIMLSSNMFEMNTDLIHAEGVGSGPGLIRGQLINENRYGSESHHIFEQVPVILTDLQNTPLSWTATNSFGQFVFENISLGSYLLHADIAGMWARVEPVTLTTGFTIQDSVLIKVYQESPFSITENKKSIKIISLYPNPVDSKINMALYADKASSININVYNLTGHLLESKHFALHTGDNTIFINTENYPSGLYMMSIYNERNAEVISKKFVKK